MSRLDDLAAKADAMVARVDAICAGRSDARPSEHERVGAACRKMADRSDLPEAARSLYKQAAAAYFEGRMSEGDRLSRKAEESAGRKDAEFRVKVRNIKEATAYKAAEWEVEYAPGVITYLYAGSREEVLKKAERWK